MGGRLDKLHRSGCRFMLWLIASSNRAVFFASTGSSPLLAPGVGWFVESSSLLPYQWLGFSPLVNSTDPGYPAMKQGFDKYWLEDYNKGLNKVSTTALTA